MNWFDGAKRVLFVHAHPDDETILTGGTIAALQEQGQEPAILTFTRGEMGEVRPEAEEAMHNLGLVSLRALELESALQALFGKKESITHTFLGSHPARAAGLEPRIYADSGMEWGDDGFARASSEVGVNAVTKAAVTDVIADTLAYADSVGADAIVSYDANGGYGHPDHVLAHRVARSVAHGLEIAFWSIEEGAVAEKQDLNEGLLRIDVTSWLQQKLSALRAYSSQLEVLSQEELQHVGGQRQAISSVEVFRRHEMIH